VQQHLDPTTSEINDRLRFLGGEVSALMVLAYKLHQDIAAALERLEPTREPVDLSAVVRRAALPDLVEAIFGRGERSAAWTRTRLHQRLEERRGRRLPGGGGQDRVTHPNGRGAARQLELELHD
jgi:hypothetical protein